MTLYTFVSPCHDSSSIIESTNTPHILRVNDKIDDAAFHWIEVSQSAPRIPSLDEDDLVEYSLPTIPQSQYVTNRRRLYLYPLDTPNKSLSSTWFGCHDLSPRNCVSSNEYNDNIDVVPAIPCNHVQEEFELSRRENQHTRMRRNQTRNDEVSDWEIQFFNGSCRLGVGRG
jgi:hypothetical protein